MCLRAYVVLTKIDCHEVQAQVQLRDSGKYSSGKHSGSIRLPVCPLANNMRRGAPATNENHSVTQRENNTLGFWQPQKHPKEGNNKGKESILLLKQNEKEQ